MYAMGTKMNATTIRHVGILFSGGPAPAANTVLSAAVMNFINAGVEVYGFIQGFHFIQDFDESTELVPDEHYKIMTLADVSGIRNHRAIRSRDDRYRLC